MRTVRKPIIYNQESLRIRSRGRLPHWELDNGYYHVTYRLGDSLPLETVRALSEEWKRIAASCRSLSERAAMSRLFGRRIDTFLDAGVGSCVLRNERAADILVENWHHFHHELYELLAWSVMPNHAHVVFRLFRGDELDRVLHSWKSFTGTEVNKVIGARGHLWAKEYWDTIARDTEELCEDVRYVLDNPAKAGLKNWRWSGSLFVPP